MIIAIITTNLLFQWGLSFIWWGNDVAGQCCTGPHLHVKSHSCNWPKSHTSIAVWGSITCNTGTDLQQSSVEMK